ncbi:MAG: putative DNA binding domain-containing protein [Bacteroidales bacterium]|nr:putative DNA binding domain-containing protein [Bacteroidales bacterium]
MALPINIEDLLNKRKIEGNRIEFKKGWNPVDIYHSICAFANDFDNLGGGYVLVGVEQDGNGLAKRPVTGIKIEMVDGILKQMVGFNNMFDPYYLPRTSVEEVDGKPVLVIWAPSGVNRPYAIPMDVKAKAKQMKYYIRSGSSSIVAKGEVLDELRDMANRVPFDDRGNPDIQTADISTTLLRDYLVTVNSRLANENLTGNLLGILEQMNLLEGPTEKRMIKNVAAMMFCGQPTKFFPVSQVEIVTFPEGRETNPNNLVEAPVIKGPVPYMIRETLNYLRTNVIKEQIIKPENDERSIRFFNYPYQALEEAVVNALYHRNYQLREPVEITIEPEKITILSHAGPDRSISLKAIKEARILRSRRYRNRRLGEFLKELDLTEGRATGIPTIQEELRKNGSGKAVIETDDDRTYFLMDIPCHPYWHQDVKNESLNDMVELNRLSSRQKQIIQLIRDTPHISQTEMAKKLNVSRQTIYRDIAYLSSMKVIVREGAKKKGYWLIVELQ